MSDYIKVDLDDADVKVGDTVRVTLEGKVATRGTFHVELLRTDDEAGDFCLALWTDGVEDEESLVVAFEKVEPPVEVFKAGDIVRDKHFPDVVFVLTLDGYVDFYNGGSVVEDRDYKFKSDKFEKLDSVQEIAA